MSSIRNRQISLYCIYNKITKGSGTSFLAPVLSQKHVRNIFSTARQYLTIFHFDTTLEFKRNKHKCNFHYIAMPMMMSKILKSADFTKTQNLDISRKKNYIFFK